MSRRTPDWNAAEGHPLIGYAGGTTHKTCQWIESDPADLPRDADHDSLYCGGKVKEGSPYCTNHHERCYLPRKPKGDKPWLVPDIGQRMPAPKRTQPICADTRLPR